MRQVTHYRPEAVWNLLSEVERAFGEVSGTRAATPRGETFTPPVDVLETGDNYLVSVDLPGVSEKDIKIDLQPGRLVVSGERTRTHQFPKRVLEILVPKVEIAKSRSIQINKEKGGLFSRLLHQKNVASKSDAAESH